VKKTICDNCKVVYVGEEDFILRDARCPVCGGKMIGYTAERGIKRGNYDWLAIDTVRLMAEHEIFI